MKSDAVVRLDAVMRSNAAVVKLVSVVRSGVVIGVCSSSDGVVAGAPAGSGARAGTTDKSFRNICIFVNLYIFSVRIPEQKVTRSFITFR